MKNTSKLKIRKIKSITNPLIKTMVVSLKVGSMAGVIIVAPNAASAFNSFINSTSKDKKKTARFNEYAKRTGYFDIKDIGNNKYAIVLTSKGEQIASDILLEDYTIVRPKKWDGQWHILMFDIKESNRNLRDRLRRKILDLGLEPLQDSVYVYPYNFEYFINSLRSYYPEHTKLVLGITASYIEGQDQLIEKFHKKKVL